MITLISFMFGAVIISFIVHKYITHKKEEKKYRAAVKKFELRKASFDKKGLTTKSMLDIEINPIIEEEAEKSIKVRKYRLDKERYIVKCINANICPNCGIKDKLEDISVPLKPYISGVMKKCKNCGWQLVLSDLKIP